MDVDFDFSIKVDAVGKGHVGVRTYCPNYDMPKERLANLFAKPTDGNYFAGWVDEQSLVIANTLMYNLELGASVSFEAVLGVAADMNDYNKMCSFLES